ncbi:CDP-glycerol:glycerophosphate glycerophosphotransferase [Arthrobacter sp. zg-Y411]|uniref:bifunctional glycosyltransferase/CDP-glycerol:glycerophosphate glycerophosphotransferase n=1 Tax=Arthrobacter zhangbolii TaxID=2886936 RepID=UPI001D13FD0F|nr:CDP-glycerol glycerophosphotransferase family protein [Arthrobacter zhangbolii]MCC3293040.1 CDP-glycerol:glycerophosphate glycerophosphotransferase [Arthrobacter zhangbolii]
MITLQGFRATLRPTGPDGGLRALARSLHPALNATLRRMAAPGPRDADLLSVIIPMHNVAPYLDRCLRSIISQTYRRLEIILVDDGSTDATAAIAAGYARYDRRIRMLRQPHRGNGQARNTAIAAARGRFLTFADADDVVPPGAYSAMVRNLLRTGSDFCVGSYGRIRGNKRSPVRLADGLHARPRLGTTVAECPRILDDVFLWNKVFVRDFWDREVGRIPEGVRYEDQETTARAYLRAASFDILTEGVYWWRIREDGSSLTQGKHRTEDLRDRLAVTRAVAALLHTEAPSSVLTHWYGRLLGVDLIPYIEQVPDAPDEYWQMLHSGIREFLAVGDEYLSGADPQSRVLLHLTAGGHRDDVRRAVIDRINNGTASPLHFDAGRIFAQPLLVHAVNAPIDRELLEVMPAQLEPVAALDAPLPATGETATVHGFAYLRNVDLRTTPLGLTIEVAVSGGVPRQEVPVRRFSNPQIDLLSGDRNCSYAASAFSVELGLPLPQELTIRLEVDGHRTECTVPVPAPDSGPGDGADGGPGDAPRPAPVSGKRAPLVTRFSVHTREGADELRFEVAKAPPGVAFALVTARHRLPAKVQAMPGGSLLLRVPLTVESWDAKLSAPPSGSYTLRWNSAGRAAGPGDPAVPAGESALRGLTPILLPACRVRGTRTDSGDMAVTLGAPLTDDEAGTFHQYRLRRAAFTCPKPASHGMFFESFGGKSCTDSPRAISDYLAEQGFDEPIYWSVADRSVPVPAYAVPLLQGTADWYDKLSTTSRLVNNNNFPWYFRKSPGQFYLQTWHGKPLKKIGRDIPQRLLALSYRDLMEREAQWWDLLLAPDERTGSILCRALGYTGEVLASGYPRNEALLGTDTRVRTRELLGIRPGQKTILYAPTWRDAARDGTGRPVWAGFLEVQEASRLLGPDYVFLIRGHHNVAAQRRIEDHPRALDVTDYPEVNDLYHAADALVTDYSSTLFDYELLGRPTFILAPDLEEFSRLRGLYLDPASDLAHIPLVTTTADLADALRHGLTVRPRAGEAAPLVPGESTKSAADALLAHVPAGVQPNDWRQDG